MHWTRTGSSSVWYNQSHTCWLGNKEALWDDHFIFGVPGPVNHAFTTLHGEVDVSHHRHCGEPLDAGHCRIQTHRPVEIYWWSIDFRAFMSLSHGESTLFHLSKSCPGMKNSPSHVFSVLYTPITHSAWAEVWNTDIKTLFFLFLLLLYLCVFMQCIYVCCIDTAC